MLNAFIAKANISCFQSIKLNENKRKLYIYNRIEDGGARGGWRSSLSKTERDYKVTYLFVSSFPLFEKTTFYRYDVFNCQTYSKGNWMSNVKRVKPLLECGPGLCELPNQSYFIDIQCTVAQTHYIVSPTLSSLNPPWVGFAHLLLHTVITQVRGTWVCVRVSGGGGGARERSLLLSSSQTALPAIVVSLWFDSRCPLNMPSIKIHLVLFSRIHLRLILKWAGVHTHTLIKLDLSPPPPPPPCYVQM